MAPKKGKGTSLGGGGAKKSASTPSVPTGEDTSFIVFSNSKGEPKSNAKAKQPSSEGPLSQPEPPKKPDTRTLIGGASWTGKLPVNLLAEHCQKQKWERPEYTMSKTQEAFSSMVILKSVNQKTKELTSLPPFKLPPTDKHLAQQPTALEARHFAATYALFRISSMKNVHMMLPPAYRDLWKSQFSDLKAADMKEGRGWMYESDPFAAKLRQDDLHEARAKKREEQLKTKGSDHDRNPDKSSGSGSSKIDRSWSRAPKVELGKNIRLRIEDLAKRHANWNLFNVKIPETQRRVIIDELTDAGFRRSHVEEAVVECKDREEAVEWLLIHVPEDDLPLWSFPEGYTTGVSLASNDLVREAKLRRLAETGYSVDDCRKALDDALGDERGAAERLQKTLLKDDESTLDLRNLGLNDHTDAWVEESLTCEAIYGDRYSSLSETASQVTSAYTNRSAPVFFRFIKPISPYPEHPPLLSVLSSSLPTYIRLSIVRQAVQYARRNFLNEPMIFSLVDWLEANIQRIIASPGKLRDVTLLPLTEIKPQSRDTHRAHTNRFTKPSPLDFDARRERSAKLKQLLDKRQSTPAYQTMLASRKKLPAWALKDELVTTVRDHAVTIISGETGSGKSTQSVQFILDDMISRNLGCEASIIVTQPRRISALGLADRVSEERCTSVGQEVGYTIRGESRHTRGVTKISFVTTGVLLRRLQSPERVESSNDMVDALAGISHVVVDECHERSLDTDFLLAVLKEALNRWKDLKVILMSATLDSNIFTDYFGGHDVVGQVDIQGRTFPITDYYLDDIIQITRFSSSGSLQRNTVGSNQVEEESDNAIQDPDAAIGRAVRNLGMGINYNLIAELIKHIQLQLGRRTGAVLIFLPGAADIDRCLRSLRAVPNLFLLPLHASLQPAEQRRAFRDAPKGSMKVVAATNVAETSITIPDVVAVIDTGRVKETSYDPGDNMVKLGEQWASRAACKQRRGRAGRVAAGSCYKLYTQAAEAKMPERPEPEIRRVPLEQLCLSVKAMGIQDVESFLRHILTPPEDLAVSGALQLLQRIGALQDQHLTALGKHLAMIPADLRCSKLLVFGAVFGCLESCLTIAAILTIKSPFVSPLNKREEAKAARMAFSQGDGDLLTDLEAYNKWYERKSNAQYSAWQVRDWCTENFLSSQTLQSIDDSRGQYLSSLKEIGFSAEGYLHVDNKSQVHSRPLLRALIAGAFSPQIAEISFPEKKFAAGMSGAVEMDPEARTIKYFNQANGRVFVHPSSVLFDSHGFTGNAQYVSYFHIMATTKVFVRDLTPFNAYGLLLFSGPITVEATGLVVDGFRLRGWPRIGVLVSRLRLMLDEILEEKVENPDADISASAVVSSVRRLIEWNGLDQ